MKKFIILLILFFPLMSVFSKEDSVISLSEICDGKLCTPRLWWIKDEFQKEFVEVNPRNDDSWKEVKNFPIWVNKYYSKSEKIHTFTLTTFFDLPTAMHATETNFGIGFSEIGEVFEIYFNGHLIASEGVAENGRIKFHRTVRGVTYSVEREFIKEKDNQLTIKITGNPNFDHTGLYFTKGYLFGDYSDIAYFNRDFITVILTGIYIIFGLYHLFLFFKRRKDRNNFHFGYLSLSIGIYIYCRTNLIFENNWDSEIIQRIELIVLYPMVAAVVLFLEELFFQKITKQGEGFRIFSIALAIPTIFVPIHWAEYLLQFWQMVTLLYGFPLMIYRLIQAVRKKIPNAKLVLISFAVALSASAFDILDSLFFNTGLSFAKYAFFTLIMMLMFILANKFVQLHNYTEELNENLEKKVDERTKALHESLDKVNQLKTQQDGDYYLTSLITRPLGVNMNKSKFVNTQIFIAQKKKFHFRTKEGELGGDICVTGNLRFDDQGNRHVMFFNGDAMGKSMQGAGGAIVAGTVINNIMSKSARNDKILTNISPEKWLKATLIELEKTFRTFGGSMLVSGVLGLISEATGELMYFNAEHPFVVLYREGVADFIDKEIHIRKLGTGVNDKFVLMKIQLQPGDIVFVGSDGRDDIRMGENRIMNEDEYLFLQKVMEAKGNLDELVKLLESTGEITDDLSLLRVSYREEFA